MATNSWNEGTARKGLRFKSFPTIVSDSKMRLADNPATFLLLTAIRIEIHVTQRYSCAIAYWKIIVKLQQTLMDWLDFVLWSDSDSLHSTYLESSWEAPHKDHLLHWCGLCPQMLHYSCQVCSSPANHHQQSCESDARWRPWRRGPANIEVTFHWLLDHSYINKLRSCRVQSSYPPNLDSSLVVICPASLSLQKETF